MARGLPPSRHALVVRAFRGPDGVRFFPGVEKGALRSQSQRIRLKSQNMPAAQRRKMIQIAG